MVDNKITVTVVYDLTLVVGYKPIGALTTGVVLPESISLVDEALDIDYLIINSEVELFVDIPEGKYIESLKVGEEEVKGSVVDGKFTVTVVADLTITISFGNYVYSLTYNINDGMFVFTEEYIHNELTSNAYILEETNITNWEYNGEVFTFGNAYTYLDNITLTATVEALPESAFTYEIVAGKAVISKVDNPLDVKVLIFPNTLGGYPVDVIGNAAGFITNKKVIRYLKLSDSATMIEYMAFHDEKELREVILPSGLIEISALAFAHTKIEKIIIPKTVQSIGYAAFFNTKSLKEVIFEDEENSELTTLGIDAFASSGISTFKLVNDVDIVGMDIFHGCTQLEEITLEATSTRYILDEHGVLYLADGTTLVYYPAAKTLTTYDIQAGTQKIDDYAFYMSSNLTKVNMPSSLTEIGASAFSYTSIQYLVIPLSVATIKASAFLVASSLAMTIYVETTSAQAGWAENWDYGIAAVYYSPNWAYDAFGVPYPL